MLKIIEFHQPNIFSIQETMLQNNNQFNLLNYNCYRWDGPVNVKAHGGVAHLIHENVPHNSITQHTNTQAVAEQVTFRVTMTVCSIYFSQKRSLTKDDLN